MKKRLQKPCIPEKSEPQGIDAITNEPIEADHPFMTAPNLFMTPHISWAALECRRKLKDIAVDNVEAFLSGEKRNIVNM